MVMNPNNRNPSTNGQSVPGNYGFNLNPISRQTPTGKFVAESVRGQGMDTRLPGLMKSWTGGGAFGNEVFSGSGPGRNVNTGISNLNRTRFRK